MNIKYKSGEKNTMKNIIELNKEEIGTVSGGAFNAFTLAFAFYAIGTIGILHLLTSNRESVDPVVDLPDETASNVETDEVTDLAANVNKDLPSINIHLRNLKPRKRCCCCKRRKNRRRF